MKPNHRPLLSEFAIFLPVGGAEAEQRLQAVPVGLHILIVYVHVVQVLLLLKDLLSCTWAHKHTGCQRFEIFDIDIWDVAFAQTLTSTHTPRRRARSPGRWCRPRWRRRRAGTRARPRRSRGGRCLPGSSSSTLRGKRRWGGGISKRMHDCGRDGERHPLNIINDG